MSAPASASADERVRDLGLDHALDALGRGEIRLGQRHDAAPDAEQVDDREMLARLRHDAVIGRDDQQHEIDAGRAGQHVVHELLVPRHVDEAEHAAVRRRQVGEAEIDRDAARLLLLQAVGIDAGQRAHERGLAVVDMARGADDHVPRAAARLRQEGRARPRGSAGRARSACVLDAADHRDRQAGAARPRARQRAACCRVSRGRIASPALGTDSTGNAPEPIWLAQSIVLDGETLAQRPRASGAARRCASAAISVFGRASRRSVGRRCGQPVRIAIEPQRRLEHREPHLVDAQRALHRIAVDPRRSGPCGRR